MVVSLRKATDAPQHYAKTPEPDIHGPFFEHFDYPVQCAHYDEACHTMAQGEEPYEADQPDPFIKTSVIVEITKTGYFRITDNDTGEMVQLDSEWKVAAFLTELNRNGKVEKLDTSGRDQTFEEWVAKGNEVKIIPPVKKELHKNSAGKISMSLDELLA